MMPTRLTAIPARTMTSRSVLLSVAPRLATAIRKPANVTMRPAMTIPAPFFCNPLFRDVFERLRLQEQRDRRDQSGDEQREHDDAAVTLQADAETGERSEENEKRDALQRVRSHGSSTNRM